MSWRWGPHTLRARLTLWYMAVMLAVLGVYVSVVLALVARNLSGALDARLRSDFRWAAEMAEQGPDGSLSWFEGDPWSADGPWLQVWSPAGRLIYRTSVAARLPVPDYLRQRALSERLRVASPQRLAAAEFREVSRLAVNVNQIARCLHQGRLLPKGTRLAFERLRALLLQLLPQAKD